MTEYANPPSVVCDCMIFLQAVANEQSPAAEIFRLLDKEKITLFISDSILREVKNVLSRPEVRKCFPHLTDKAIEVFLERLQNKAIEIFNIPEEFRYQRDSKDEPYVNLALVTRSAYLVSRDTDLLDLMDENKAAGKSFRFKYPFLRIVKPQDFLDEIENTQKMN